VLCFRNDLANIFRAFGFTATGVRGRVRVRPIRVGALSAAAALDRVDCDIAEMSTESKSYLAGDCTLVHRPERGLQYKQDFVMAFTNRAAPVMPRPPACLGAQGVGPVVAIDLGGRANTAVHISQPGADADVLSFRASEHCKGLERVIIAQSVKWKKDEALAKQSREERLTDPRARTHFQRLAAEVESRPATAPRDWVMRAKGRQLRIGKRHGALGGDEVETDLEQAARMLPDDEGEEGDEVIDELEELVRREVAGPAAELLANRTQAQQRRLDQERDFGDEHLGPLWTREVDDRYWAFVEERYQNGFFPVTKRFYLKYKIEKRLRRRVKWRKRRMRGKVRSVQNDALKTMIPIGTSYVVCGRLNFLTFRLSKVIMMYFSFLSLASYHNRIRNWCENIGAALVSVSEGYTTKKCPKCGKHVNVGAAKVFQCRDCGFRRHRDIKVRNWC
jgi:predicted RNA-binding Zn-ribbon protein involved in translation (DUF1610 family)